MMKKNYKGMKSWFFPGFKVNIERWLFSFHRLTGIILVFYLCLHIIVVGSRAYGKDAWIRTMKIVGVMGEGFYRNLVHFFEYLLVLAVGFHALNGLRLLITEFGFLLGKPRRPEYPYVALSLKGPRAFLYFLMICFFVYLILGFKEFFIFK
ncbi:MAG: hypothetical protein ABDH49_04170 [Candidatus Hydrothermales bacterium]